MLTGNLCSDTALIKTSAATPTLLRHRGPAVVFEDHARLRAGAPLRRPGGRTGNAGMGDDPDPREAGPARRDRHGADLRRSHERYFLLDVRPPHLSGVCRRRPSRRDPGRRHHLARCRQPDPGCRTRRHHHRGTLPSGTGTTGRDLRAYPLLYAENVEQVNLGADFGFFRDMTPAVDPLYGPTTC